jgi:hypothetical protein
MDGSRSATLAKATSPNVRQNPNDSESNGLSRALNFWNKNADRSFLGKDLQIKECNPAFFSGLVIL